MLRWGGESVHLAVHDSGVGIPAAELPRLFDRFHRVKGAQSRTHEGTGIGLALVQELVHAQGGAVRVDSQEGHGSTFTVTLKTGCAHLPHERIGAPRSQAATVTHAVAYVEEARQWTANDSHPADVVSAPGGSRPHILWADDNADMREYVRRLLSADYDVTAVPDGITAVETARVTPPDLVLTDVMMPGLDGFGVLRLLRADARTRAVPVILLSARAGEESSVEGLEAGADDYLIKPFSRRELLARVRTHLELAKMRRDLDKHRIAAIEADNVRIVEADRLKTAYLANMSHELRSPLNSILGFAELMHDGRVGPVADDHREYLGDILTSARHLLHLINDILDMAKIEAGKMEFRPEAVDVGEIVLEMQVLSRSRADEKRIALVAHVDRAVGDATLDPVKLKEVLFNFVSNAIKFTPDGGQVMIAVRDVSKDQFGIDVTDAGIGISEADQERLFIEFQQLERGRSTPQEGTGLGLALTKRIVEAQGGRVQVRSSPGAGSTFSVILPRHIVTSLS